MRKQLTILLLGVFLLCGARVEAQNWTHVQANVRDQGTTNTSHPIAYSSNVTSGNLLVTAVAQQDLAATLSISSVAGSAGVCDGTWTLRQNVSDSLYIYSSTATGTGACTVTVTLGVTQPVGQGVWEASLSAGTATFDTSCSGITSPAAATHDCDSSLTTANTHVYGVSFTQTATSMGVSAQPGGWTTSSSGAQELLQHLVVTTATTTDAEWTSVASEGSIMGTVTFSDAGGGGATPAPKLMLMGVGGW